MRFRFRGNGEGEGDELNWTQRTPREDSSPAPRVMSRHQQIEFLRLVHDGLGRMMACGQLKVSERALRRSLARNVSFRIALEHVEQVQAENLHAILYAAALKGDTHAARFLLARHDRRAELRKTWSQDAN